MGFGVVNVVGAHCSKHDPIYWPKVLELTAREHRAIASLLHEYPHDRRRAVEFGCGYGRMLPALADEFKEVAGYEWDKELSRMSVTLGFTCGKVDSLAQVPEETDCADLTMSWSTLLNIPDAECQQVVAEMRRVSHSLILISELTNPNDPCRHVIFPRSSQTYEAWIGLPLLESRPRPKINGADTGHMMLFRKA